MRLSLRLALVFLASSLLLVAGCSATSDSPPSSSGSTSGGTVENAVELRIEPADAQIALDGATAKSLAFKAVAKLDDGSEADVTAQASFTIDDVTLGVFAGATFTSTKDKAGKTLVRAKAAGLEATAPLAIRLQTILITEGTPPGAPGDFGGPDDPTGAPSIVYPSDGVLVPPNMNSIEFHFVPGAGQTLFELGFLTDSLDVKVYLTCTPLGAGCVYAPDKAAWELLAESARGGDPVTFTLRGVNGESPAAVGKSASQTMSFGQEDIVGGLYYWNAAAGKTMRYEFGKTGQAAETYMTAAGAGATTCVGCHVLSRDGKRVAFGLDIPSPAPYKVFDVATKTQLFTLGSIFGGGGSNFFTFSPDASQMMTSNGVSIGWRDAATGVAINESLVPVGAMPDWSPDGKDLVYARPQTAPPCFGPICGAPGVDKASLEVIHANGATWSAAETLVAYSGQNNYYPAYSPDSAWVLFNRSPSDVNSFDAPDAQVWVVSRLGGEPIQLAKASTKGDSWPKWTTRAQDYRGKKLLWLTFSSRRAYGLRLAQGSVAQIWMTAFDPDRAAAGEDASYPAFWLPFQDPASGNHIAQWVEKVERKPCVDTSECEGGEKCENGHCEPAVN